MDTQWRGPRTSRYLLPVRTWKRWVAVVAMLAAAGCLAGCSTGPGKPTTLPTLTPTTGAATPTPSPTASDLEAATNVVRRYYALLNAPTTAANADALSRLMTSTCKCQEVVEVTRAAVRKHERFFGRNQVVKLTPSRDGSAAAEVLVTYNYTRSGLLDANGRVVSQSTGRRGTTQVFRLLQSPRGWLITAIERVTAGAPE